MKRLIIFLISIPLLLLNLDCTAQKRNRDKEALNKIKQLPEVKDYLRKTGKDLLPMIREDGGPTKEDNYYVYSVGISNFDIFRTSMRFYVDARTMQVYFWDFFSVDQELIPLKEWRYWRTKPVWNQSHRIVNGKMIYAEYK